jgi:hypothetical protein
MEALAMRHMHRLFATVWILTVAGCLDEPQPMTSAQTPTSATGPAAFLTISPEAPQEGGTVVVTANVLASSAQPVIGSFSGELRYDPAGLTFAGESRLAGGMRAFNPASGRIRVAGAAAEGFLDGRLFAVAFKVGDPRAVAGLELLLDELNGRDFGDRLPSDPRERLARVVQPKK